MSTLDDVSNKRVYKLRRKNFQNRLVKQLSYLGFSVIIIEYLKFGSSIWTLAIRLGIQSLLTSPFPNESQIARLSLNSPTRRIPQLGRDWAAEPIAATEVLPNEVPFPGGFSPVTVPRPIPDLQQREHQTSEEEDPVVQLKLRIQWLLFHCSLTLNCFYIIISLIWPIDFRGKLGAYLLDDRDLNNTPSLFNSDGDLTQGERKGTLFIQMIGELVPSSNFWGNFHMLMFEFLILVCQFGLFSLTCFKFSGLFEEDEDTGVNGEIEGRAQSDGYDGNVIVAKVDPIGTVDQVLEIRKKHSNPEHQPTSMV